ncbi:MAG: protein kinase domain-containing protein [Phycisphaerales bacterium]
MAGTMIAVLASVLAVALAVLIVMFVLVPIFKGVGWGVRHVFAFITGEIGDVLRIVGAVITNVVLIPLTVASVVIGRWSASAHYGRAIQSEFKTIGMCIYRIALGHPARFLCLSALTEGIERRLPEVVAVAPGADKPAKARAGQFDGYTIVGSLPGGGSGGRLYVAEPDELKKAGFARNGQPDVEQVVIKAFSLRDGSSLPQIVRESRALDAAKKLGLVLEHELNDERFFYITKFIPGESLGLVTQRLHAQSPSDGLDTNHLRVALGYGADLLRTLDAYHRGGLWHKDVKPDNIIVDGRAAHLVDFGLITPMRSAMTLTTHGTEYFRDPEMVRLALKGVKVHQVDGAKFDLYAAGAVLFSVIENSFPAHGGLSQVTRKCPDALRWIVRRAMTDYDRRYPSVAMMLADVETVRLAADPFTVRPADLPSVREGDPMIVETLAQDPLAAVGVSPAAAAVGMAGAGMAGMGAPGVAAAAAGAAAMGAMGAAPAPGAAAPPPGRSRPRIRVAHWWSGRYQADAPPGQPANPQPEAGSKGFVFTAGMRGGKPFFNIDRGQDGGASQVNVAGSPQPPRAARVRHAVHRSAGDQLKSAHARVQAARERARLKMESRRARRQEVHGAGFQNGFNPGVAAALFVFLGACVAMVGGVMFMARQGNTRVMHEITTGPDGGELIGAAHMDLPAPAPVAAAEPPRAPHAPAPDPERSRPRVELVSPAATITAPADARVMFLTELLPPQPETTARTIESVRDRLAAAGFTLIGNFWGNPAAGEELEEQNTLETSLRTERGVAPLESDETRRLVGRWLAAENAADLLVWLEASKQSPSGVRAHLFVPALDPESDGPGVARAERMRSLVQRSLGTK